MDLMSLLGWVIGVVLIFAGMVINKKLEGGYEFLLGNVENFFDLTSIVIVIGGTIVALMVSYPGSFFKKILKHLKIVLFPTKYNPQSYIEQLVEFAKEARINGLLALEDKLNQTEDVFLKNSLMLVVDSVEAEKVKALLETELDYLDERHAQDRGFYEKGAAYAPAFGMIGTLIGLINLLQHLDSPDTLGSSMGVALITTFYGTIMANLIFNPIAAKLKNRHDEEYLCKMIISEGVQAIQAGDNPKFIEEKLTQLIPNFLASKGMSSDEEGGGKGKKEKKKKEK